MTLVDTDEYRQGGAPTIFEDRTIFPPPEVVGQRVGSSPRRGSPFMAFLALILMAVCGFLAWMVWGLQGQIEGIRQEVTTEQQVTFETQIEELRADNQRLNVENSEFSGVRDRARRATEIRAEIAEKVAERPRLPAVLLEAIAEVPDWATPARIKAAEELDTHIAAQLILRDKIIDHDPPARSSQPTSIENP